MSVLDDAEKEALRKALEARGGNVRATASDLDLSRQGLYKKLLKHGLHQTRASKKAERQDGAEEVI